MKVFSDLGATGCVWSIGHGHRFGMGVTTDNGRGKQTGAEYKDIRTVFGIVPSD